MMLECTNDGRIYGIRLERGFDEAEFGLCWEQSLLSPWL